MQLPTVSVIVPVYNSDKYLSECIESILHQTFSDIELILVNDGSTDNSLSIGIKYSENDSRIKIVNQSNQGATVARKKGVNTAQGDYILFVDSDDILPSDSIETLISASNESIDIVIGTLNNDYVREGLINADTYRIRCIEGSVFPGPVGKLFRRKLFNDHVFDIPREIIKGEDMIMNVRVAFNCTTNILLLPKVVYEYRRHEESCVSKFRTNWSYEGIFYEHLFASVPIEEQKKFMPYLIIKAMEVWNDFYGYKYRLPNDYVNSAFYLLLRKNIKIVKAEASQIDSILVNETNILYRFILINIKRIFRITKQL